MSIVSSNWRSLLQQNKVNPINPAATPRHKRKRGTDDRPATATSSTSSTTPKSTSSSALLPPVISTPPVITSVIALDCEMVGVNIGINGDALARCSIVNMYGVILYDRYVQPKEPIIDYRTHISGITSYHMRDAVSFEQCQSSVSEIINNRILVGHSLQHDLHILLLSHPRSLCRDTAYYKLLCPHRPRALKTLAEEHLQINVQQGQHSSIEDARTALALYKKYSKQWEQDITKRQRKEKITSTKKMETKPPPLLPSSSVSLSPMSSISHQQSSSRQENTGRKRRKKFHEGDKQSSVDDI